MSCGCGDSIRQIFLCLFIVAYEVPASSFDGKDYFKEPKDARRNDRFTQFAVAASKLALQDAGEGFVNPNKP